MEAVVKKSRLQNTRWSGIIALRLKEHTKDMVAREISDISNKIEPTLIAVLMAVHPRIGYDSTIPVDVATLIARQIHKDVSINFYLSNV